VCRNVSEGSSNLKSLFDHFEDEHSNLVENFVSHQMVHRQMVTKKELRKRRQSHMLVPQHEFKGFDDVFGGKDSKHARIVSGYMGYAAKAIKKTVEVKNQLVNKNIL
jgi:hypothetical protein